MQLLYIFFAIIILQALELKKKAINSGRNKGKLPQFGRIVGGFSALIFFSSSSIPSDSIDVFGSSIGKSFLSGRAVERRAGFHSLPLVR